MPRYTPPSNIRALTQYHGIPLEEIPEDLLNQVKSGLHRFFEVANPEVSLVMIAQNEEDFIFMALASLSKLETKFSTELILVDNASTDQTSAIAKSLGVKVLVEPKKGWGYARNAGLKLAKAPIILTADGDNLYGTDWLDQMVRPLSQDPTVAVVCSEYCFYTFNNKYGLATEFYQWARSFNLKMRHGSRPHLNCMGGSMAFRKEQALAAGGYMNTGRGEDGKLAFKLGENGKTILNLSPAAYSFAALNRSVGDRSLLITFFHRIFKNLSRLRQFFTKQTAG